MRRSCSICLTLFALEQIFGVPRLARRSKPFIDHVISFSILDDKIWFRNYQIIEKDPGSGSLVETEVAGEGKKRKPKSTKGEEEQPTLVEIGPRMVLTPIRIFEGSFGGATVYENPGERLWHEKKRSKVSRSSVLAQNTSRLMLLATTRGGRRASTTRTAPMRCRAAWQRRRSWQTRQSQTSLVGTRSLHRHTALLSCCTSTSTASQRLS